MKYAIPGRPDVLYSIGDTVKLYTGIYGVVTQRSNKRKVTLELPDGGHTEVPEHYIVGVVAT